MSSPGDEQPVTSTDDEQPVTSPDHPGPSPSPGLAAELGRITGGLAGGGEDRPGQVTMAGAVETAITSGNHLVVQAGTGTGKSLAYLAPVLRHGQKAVVATATLGLQDQLADQDLPHIAAHRDDETSWAVLKGRSNYLCRQRLAETDPETAHQDTAHQETLAGTADPDTARADPDELAALRRWAATTETGDRAELTWEPSPATWSALSVSSRTCPGAARCPSGGTCFAEAARARADAADVVVTNLHLYGLHVASGGTILGDHDVVVIDEAHTLEDTMSATLGFEVSGGRVRAAARAVGSVVDDPGLSEDLNRAADHLDDTLADHAGRRLRRIPVEVTDAVTATRGHLARARGALGAVDGGGPEEAVARARRATRQVDALTGELDLLTDLGPDRVAWVTEDRSVTLAVAPIEVGPHLAEGLWDRVTAVLTSATIPASLVDRVGLADRDATEIDVGSPFDFAANTLLYCAAHLPEPREGAHEAAMHDELAALIDAAGGRTLSLFTSYRAMDAALAAMRERLALPLLGQRDLPRPELVARFRAEEAACVFATVGFFSGIDVPGPALSLVTVDRLPFPRPDDPLLSARRERAGVDAFTTVDLPRTATLLAQGAGRLVRTATDRGVVAVLDARLATRRSYRWDIIGALPPMRRTKSRDEAVGLLRELTEAG